MNDANRKRLNDIRDQLDSLKSDLESVLYEEEEKRDNTPENFQSGERYSHQEDVCSYLDEAVNQLDETISNIESAVE